MQGGCSCGRARYEVEGWPSTVVQCHCCQCRRSVGSTPVTWATFPRRLVRLENVRWYRASQLSRRGFCSRCGTSLFFQHRRSLQELDITVVSFDQPERLPPQRHCFVPDRLPWVALEKGLPRHQGDTHSPLMAPPAGEPDLREIYRRALSQIALQAYPDPTRVVALAETLAPAYKYNAQQLSEALAAYVAKYPDGAGYLLEPLEPKNYPSL